VRSLPAVALFLAFERFLHGSDRADEMWQDGYSCCWFHVSVPDGEDNGGRPEGGVGR
jgi:hypothetical protein